MCGILLVQCRQTLPVEQHLAAVKYIQPRGPDFLRYEYKNNIFIAQSVLHITGNQDYYTSTHEDFLAYNGEIYNYQEHGHYNNDIELVADAVPDNLNQFRQFRGPWAWAWTDFDRVLYASDPQGEKSLFRYQDNDILIVSSEISAILHYVDITAQAQTYASRHWPIFSQTPYAGIDRIVPGQAFDHNQAVTKIDSIFDWVSPAQYQNQDQAYEEFVPIWRRTIREMTPAVPAGLAFSGGVDSSCILSAMPDLAHLYTVNNTGKETVGNRARDFLTDQQQSRLIELPVDAEVWAQQFQALMAHTRLPAQSWSFVGQWNIAQHCAERVLFTGVGADELHGGYSVYQRLQFSQAHSTSPYSDHQPLLWQQCLDCYNQDPVQATLLQDYVTQCCAVDLRGIDLVSMAHGVEPRSPFVNPAMIKFALNLPVEYKQGKPLLRRLFLETWPTELLLPKQGFAGHCNDSYAWLGIDIPRVQDRDQDWKNILTASFLRSQPRQLPDQTTPQ
jgi:asparagine synthase (glutamine-hydrolysing)